MNKKQLSNWLLKYGAAAYGGMFALVTAIFFKFNFYKLNDTANIFYRAKHNISKLGLNRLRGNVTQLNNPVMILILVVGVVLALYLIVQKHTDLFAHMAALLILVGSVIPFMPPYDENLLARLYLAIAMIVVGGLVQFAMVITYSADPN
ncbi:hypothetical protein [Lacticaseibacillus hulanensis]|uniref:hypothetical protein n=1 Tax=Lacticaseibacillus hulanensis TaxID=2493111 RepID=UPI000FDC0AC2|nr:hypothetical protein [Lacticaseibacillus hulanensis]